MEKKIFQVQEPVYQTEFAQLETEEPLEDDYKQWEKIEKKEKKLSMSSIKSYQLQLKRGLNYHKKISYKNVTKNKLCLYFETNQPKLLKIKTPSLNIKPDEFAFIKIKFAIPNICCKMLIKIAILEGNDDSENEDEENYKPELKEMLIFEVLSID